MPSAPRTLRRASAALLVSILTVVGVWAPGPLELDPAGAADGVAVVVNGRGYGHGRGLGQWGAHGYAGGQATGTPWNSDQILDHFYGGTVKGTVPNSNITVWLKTLDNQPVRIFTNAGGFTVGGLAIPAGNRARIAKVGGQWTVFQSLSCGGVEDLGTPVNDNSALPSASAADKNNLLRVCDGGAGKPYRGFLTAWDAADAGGTNRIVNTVGVEDYLRGVVPAEMPSGWEAAALQSQSVAARSYALAQGGEGGKRYPPYAKTCDDIFCQVYNGANAEVASTDAAIQATASQVRRVGSVNGAIASTEFSASTGGWTTGTSFTNVEDKGDAHPSNPHRSWSVTIDPATIATKYGLGTLDGISVTKRNGLGADGGRVTEMKLDGSTKDVTISGNTFRSDMGLKSDWFTITRGGISFQRLNGPDRFATAAAIARNTFVSSDVAIVARGEGSFADGLAANFLAGVFGAPTLLTNTGSLPQITSDTLAALGVKQVKVLGGTGAVSDAVVAQLDATYEVERISGPNRYATAAAVAKAGAASIGSFTGKKTAVLSSGVSFPDALAAGGIVYAMKFPQLLTDPATLPPETGAVLTELGIKHVIITGGEGAISAGVKAAVEALGITTERPHGSDRFQTAKVLADLAIASWGFSPVHVDIPTGESFPDALTAGPHAGKGKAPIVLGTKLGVANATCAFLRDRSAALKGGHIFGGTGAIEDSAKTALEGCTRP
jgi:SpoIID/LytB domain protein